MRTFLAPFHPDLENSLVDEILRHKTADLLTPLLILAPSDLLRRRLKVLLTRERNLSLLNVHLLTFHQLSMRLQTETDGTPMDLRSDLYLEEALRQMIRARQPGSEPFFGIEERAGGCAALWQTLRDLRDGLVDPTIALDALDEGHFSQRASERTSELLHLLQTFEKFCRDKNVTDHSDLDRRATRQVPSSRFLKQFAEIFYYGFYDLTQIQVDLFHAVARHYPTSLFFPLLAARPGHDAWSFAARFYERYVQGLGIEPASEPPGPPVLPAIARVFDDVKGRIYSGFGKAWHCQIVSAFGIHDEVAAAAKEILTLIDDGKLRFHEIGVVARGFESYGRVIKEVFLKHQIPLAGTLEEPLVEFALTKAVILLVNLPGKDFLRNQVIDLLSSPYFQFHNIASHGSEPRPDLWDLASRELAICKGIAKWRRLRHYARRDLILAQLADDDEPRKIKIQASQLQTLADLVEALATDLSKLPPRASWRSYAEGWKELLKKFLGILPASDVTPPSEPPRPSEEILKVLDELAGLDAVQESIASADFSHTFQHWLERSTVIEDRRNRDGVMVLHATAARGLKFRALFILGLNEGVFPRTIREDAFLRDHDREVLERDLGHKVNSKLAAFDEEKLLFTLLISAAEERLYCSFQRADDSGRALAPSWYLGEVRRALEAEARKIEPLSIPRGVVEKATTPPFGRSKYLLPTELAVRLTLAGDDPTSLVDRSQPLPAIYKHGRKLIADLERGDERLHGYDGMVGEFDSFWKHLSERGLAPTPLETYARCPFQFFARHVLGLEPLDRPEETLGPSPAEFGELGHKILSAFYRALIESRYFAGTASPANIQSILQEVAAHAFAGYEANHPVGYPLAWESLKDGLVRLLGQVVVIDLGVLAQTGFIPVGLETEVSACLPDDWPEPLKGLAIRGRMDRIDRSDNKLRVIDYKFKFGANPTTQDKNLIRGALRGARLQPPFYFLLAEHWAATQAASAQPAIEADFYYIAPRWSDGPLVSAEFTGEGLAGRIGAATKQTIAYLAEGVRQGRFFIQRGDYCGHCEVAAICRKNHPPSLWRAENDPITKAHRELQVKDPKKL